MKLRRLIAPFFLIAGLVLIPWTIWLTMAWSGADGADGAGAGPCRAGA